MASPKNLVQEPKMSVLKSKDIAKPSLTNYYQVYFSVLTEGLQKHITTRYGVGKEFISRESGLMCADATLPTSSFATAEVKDNYHGINEQYAHTRLYIDTDFTFYVDKNYQMIKFFEGWMDYVSGTGQEDAGKKRPIELSNKHYKRFNYPLDPKSGYKISNMFITKFERDSNKVGSPMLTYQFYNVFPKSMSAIPVSYGPADVLKVTVSFAYDRYVVVQGRGNGQGSTTGETTIQEKPPGAPAGVPINPVTNEPVERPFKGLLTDQEWYDAYKGGLTQSTNNINAARNRNLREGVIGPRGL